ncbi:hypothetical protein EON63_18155, partial [archaeon]
MCLRETIHHLYTYHTVCNTIAIIHFTYYTVVHLTPFISSRCAFPQPYMIPIYPHTYTYPLCTYNLHHTPSYHTIIHIHTHTQHHRLHQPAVGTAACEQGGGGSSQ